MDMVFKRVYDTVSENQSLVNRGENSMRTTLAIVVTTIVFMNCAVMANAQHDTKSESLFNGKNLDGWKGISSNNKWTIVGDVSLNEKDKKVFALKDGTEVMVNGPAGSTTNIFSDYEHGDCQLHIEFCVPFGSNSGVYFQGLYEIQVFDSYGKKEVEFSDCGGIYARYKDNQTYEGHPPMKNASKAPGEWQTYDVIFRAPRFDANGNKTENAKFIKVEHNGVLVQDNVEVTGGTRACMDRAEEPKGPLMLQGDHGPVAYRNIQITPVELD
jgi:hypothetical protein